MSKILTSRIIERLNALLTSENVRRDIGALINTRVLCSTETVDHPEIIVYVEEGKFSLGFLGLLNGILGPLTEGPKKGWGQIAAVFDDRGELVQFEPLVKETPDTRKRMFKIRPSTGGSWLIVDDLNYLQEYESSDNLETTSYEVQMVYMTPDEIEALPEHDGW